jgi:hypothetical protein
MTRAVVVFAFLALGSAPAQDVDFKMKRLGPSLEALAPNARATIDKAVRLIRSREHTAALALLTELSRANPQNSSIKVVLAYGLLQAGNLLGAFDTAKEAEAAPDHNSYMCLFLARVAYLVGDAATCRREVQHVRQAGHFKREVSAIERDLATKGDSVAGTR